MRPSLAAEFVLLAALWGSSFLFMRFGATEFGPWATAGMRVAVASAVLLPVLALSGQWPALRRHAGPILFVGLFNSGLPFALYAYALLSISTGLSAILNATVPLFGALVAWVWLQDRPGGVRVLGLAIGFMGVALLSWNKASFQSGGTGWAIAACLAATLCYGIAASYTKKHLTGVPPLATATGSQIGATLGLAWPTVWFWPQQSPGAVAWGAIVAVGVLCTAVAYILYFRLIEQAGPSKTLTVTFLVPLFALLYGAILLGESITGWMVVCGLVILCGVALSSGLISWPRPRSPRSRPTEPHP
jgi:drug/metabolite transporter (DMT)-like permease